VWVSAKVSRLFLSASEQTAQSGKDLNDVCTDDQIYR
jgi:hypothetical protein